MGAHTATIKGKFRISMFYMCLYHFNGTNCALGISELLRSFVLQFDDWKSKNKGCKRHVVLDTN